MKFIHIFTEKMINDLCKDGKEIRITMYVIEPGGEKLYHLNSHGEIDRIDNSDRLLDEYQYIVKSWDDLFQMDDEDMKFYDKSTSEESR